MAPTVSSLILGEKTGENECIHIYPNITQNLTCGVAAPEPRMCPVRHAEQTVYVNGSLRGYTLPLCVQAEARNQTILLADYGPQT
jgi:hypothetical protein